MGTQIESPSWTKDGDLVRGDLVTALVARQLLQERGAGTILYDLRSSRVVPEVVRACGGRPVKTRVGHSFMKARMREEKALFGGELSYHFYFSDFFYCESGILAMLHVLTIVAESGRAPRLARPSPAHVRPLRGEELPRGGHARRHEESGRRTSEMARSAIWMDSPSTTKTGGSTCAHRTRSPSCG